MFKLQNNSRQADAKIYFDDFATRDAWEAAQRPVHPQFSILPATNIIETKDAFLIELVAPGLGADELSISVEGNEITVAYQPADSRFENVHQRREWRSEYRPMPFQRAFYLNGELLDMAALRVSAFNGIIRLSIPKKETARGAITPWMPFSSN
ncbi:MAG TPA: Hsp20 family protein [Saprospiraceae bacterium]|nr:Hsp20 family protein [Saprospiraceae bacterium]